MRKEPVLIIAAIIAIINTAIGFGLNWTGEQVSLINTALVAIGAALVRPAVTPTE